MSEYIYDDETTVEDKPKRKSKDLYDYELADIGTRLVGLIIDNIILGIVTGILFGAGRGPGAVVGFLAMVAYHWFFLTRQNGQTPGAMITKIRVVKTNGTSITDTDAILRATVSYISGIFICIGFLWAFIDKDRQTWHDKIANTYVIKAE